AGHVGSASGSDHHGPEGVRVEPIVDATKIAIAFFTAFGAMWMALSKMRRAANRGRGR
ncbi:MAG: hypothetical protein HC804_09210, partial [Anaerolineae bacterium]|nr:hypothetical protein [Anaerolineae bacterium]